MASLQRLARRRLRKFGIVSSPRPRRFKRRSRWRCGADGSGVRLPNLDLRDFGPGWGSCRRRVGTGQVVPHRSGDVRSPAFSSWNLTSRLSDECSAHLAGSIEEQTETGNGPHQGGVDSPQAARSSAPIFDRAAITKGAGPAASRARRPGAPRKPQMRKRRVPSTRSEGASRSSSGSSVS